VQEAEATLKELRIFLYEKFSGDALEQIKRVADIVDNYLWSATTPLDEEPGSPGSAVHQVEDLKDSWRERQKGQAQAQKELQEAEPPQKKPRKAQDEQKPKMSEEETHKLIAANKRKAEARKATKQVAEALRAASASQPEEAFAVQATPSGDDDLDMNPNFCTPDEFEAQHDLKVQEEKRMLLVANRARAQERMMARKLVELEMDIARAEEKVQKAQARAREQELLKALYLQLG